jgi:hypothetical protein
MNHKLTAHFALKSISKSGQFTGRASVYQNVDAHGDVVMPGAFTRSLQEIGGEIVVLNQHDPSDPIGKARVTDRSDGLWAEGQLILDLPSARDAYVRLQNGLIDGMSIGYEVIDQAWQGDVRQLKEIKLWEISLVTFPANSAARITDVKAQNDPEFDELMQTLQGWTFYLQVQRMLSEIRCTTLDTLDFIRNR